MRDRELLRARGIFIAEGALVVETLVTRSRFRTRAVLLSERRLPAFERKIGRAGEDVPVYVAPEEVLDQIVGFPFHRGVVASGERGPEPPIGPLIREAKTIVVLEALANHDNVGACFRHAAAFGADAVLLDPCCADPLYRKSVRVSLGAALTVPFARFASWPEALELLRVGGFDIVALTPDEAAQKIGHVFARRPRRVALLVGTEGSGLSEAALRAATISARIPIAREVDSLNAATALAIALYALGEARGSVPSTAWPS